MDKFPNTYKPPKLATANADPGTNKTASSYSAQYLLKEERSRPLRKPKYIPKPPPTHEQLTLPTQSGEYNRYLKLKPTLAEVSKPSYSRYGINERARTNEILIRKRADPDKELNDSKKNIQTTSSSKRNALYFSPLVGNKEANLPPSTSLNKFTKKQELEPSEGEMTFQQKEMAMEKSISQLKVSPVLPQKKASNSLERFESDIEELKLKQPLGLKNLGNTCFMNSILQCLIHSLPLVTKVFSERPGLNQSVSREFRNLVKEMWTKEKPVKSALSPTMLKRSIGSKESKFSDYDQQDSHEFLCILLQLMDDEKQSKGRRSFLSEDNLNLDSNAKVFWENVERQLSPWTLPFTGLLIHHVICLSCKSDSYSFESFSILSLALPKELQCSISGCIESYFKEEVIQDISNGYKCEKCKKLVAFTKKVSIYKKPAVLILHLKRFQQGRFGLSKLDTPIKLTDKIDIQQYCFQPSYDAGRNSYNLYAVSDHSGSLNGGHYVAYVKNMGLGQWFLMNDSMVSRAKPSDVSRTAYILFYSQEE